MKIIIITFLLVLIPDSLSAYSEDQKVYICLKGGGSCEAIVQRVGSDTVRVKWTETCKTINSFLGFGDFRQGETEWIPEHAIESWASSCE